MKRIIKEWGSSFVIVLGKEEIKTYNLEKGDIIDIPDKVFEKAQKKKIEKNEI